eukprot:9408997-Prorocentrum_lima.AAC.1
MSPVPMLALTGGQSAGPSGQILSQPTLPCRFRHVLTEASWPLYVLKKHSRTRAATPGLQVEFVFARKNLEDTM